MKHQVIPENERTLKDRCGFVFSGLAGEIPEGLRILAERCPRCGGELKKHYSDEVMDSGVAGSVETTADAEYCDNRGYAKRYSEEG